MSLLENVRLDSGVLKARYASVLLDSAIASSSSYRGHIFASFNIDGSSANYYMFVALASSGKVQIYQSGIAGSANWLSTWTPLLAISAPSAPFGDCRLTDNAKIVSMQIVTDTLGNYGYANAPDVLLASNASIAVGYARRGPYKQMVNVPSLPFSGVSGVGNISFITLAPPSPSSMTASATFQAGWNLSTGLSTIATTGSGLTCTQNATPNAYLTLSVSTAVSGGATATITQALGPFTPPNVGVTESLQYAPGSNVLLFIQGTGIGSWNQFTISYTPAGASQITLYNALSPTLDAFAIGMDAATLCLVLPVPLQDAFFAGRGDIVTFTWPGSPPASTVTFSVFAICVSGNQGWPTAFAGCNYQADSRAFSSFVYTSPVASLVNQISGTSAPNAISYSVPLDQRLTYSYILQAQHQPGTSPATPNYGDNQLFYAQLPGQSYYYLCQSMGVGTWESTSQLWVYTGVYGGVTSYAYFDNLLNYAQPKPPDSVLPVPAFSCSASANGRLFVGIGSAFYFSAYQKPFQFSLFAEADPVNPSQVADYSASSFTRPGENFMAIIPLGASPSGAEGAGSQLLQSGTIVLLTDSNMYEIGGFTAFSLSAPDFRSPHGTLSPLSVARSKTAVYWLDDLGQLRRYDGQDPIAISKYIVDNYTKFIPPSYKLWASACSQDERYYLAFSTGANNVQCLVYNELLAEFESLDTLYYDGAGLVSIYDPTSPSYYRLLGISSSAEVFEHAQFGAQNDPAQAGVNVSVTFPEEATDLNSSITAGSFLLVSDPGPASMTCTLTPTTGDAAATQIISLIAMQAVNAPETSNPETYVHALSTDATGCTALTIRPSVSAPMYGGTNIYQIALEVYPGPLDSIRS